MRSKLEKSEIFSALEISKSEIAFASNLFATNHQLGLWRTMFLKKFNCFLYSLTV